MFVLLSLALAIQLSPSETTTWIWLVLQVFLRTTLQTLIKMQELTSRPGFCFAFMLVVVDMCMGFSACWLISWPGQGKQIITLASFYLLFSFYNVVFMIVAGLWKKPVD